MAEAEVIAKSAQAGAKSQQQGAGGSRQYGQAPMQPGAKPLKEQSDIELLRRCSIQLRLMMDVDQRAAAIKDSELEAEFKGNIAVQLNATIAEIERRGIDKYKEISSAINSWKMGGYEAALSLVNGAVDNLGRGPGFTGETSKAKPDEVTGDAGQRKSASSLTIKSLIPISALGLVDYGGWIKKQFKDGESVNVNAVLTQVLAYASGKGWLDANANWKDTTQLETLKADPVKMALVKEMLLLACGRGFGNMKASLGRLAQGTDAAGALAAFTDGTIADAMTTTTTGKAPITKAQMKWWKGNFTDRSIITQEVADALNAPKPNAAPADVVEAPGSLDSYSGLEAFKQDWRVKVAARALGSAVNYDAYKENGGYSVAKIMEAAKSAVDSKTRDGEVDAKVESQCAKIRLIANMTNENVLERLVELGIVVEKDTRKDARKAGGAGTVKKIGDSFYALDKKKADAAGISILPADRKSVVMALGNKAEGILSDNGVQKLVKYELSSLLDEYDRIGLEGYFDGKKNLKDIIPSSLILIADAKGYPPQIEDRSTIYKLMAADGDVMEAVMAKGLDNDKAWEMVEALGRNDALKGTDGNFDKSLVLAEINKPTAQGERQVQGQANEDALSPATTFGNIDLTRAVIMPGWLINWGNGESVITALVGMDAGTLTARLEDVVSGIINGTYNKNTDFIGVLKQEETQVAGAFDFLGPVLDWLKPLGKEQKILDYVAKNKLSQQQLEVFIGNKIVEGRETYKTADELLTAMKGYFEKPVASGVPFDKFEITGWIVTHKADKELQDTYGSIPEANRAEAMERLKVMLANPLQYQVDETLEEARALMETVRDAVKPAAK